MARGFVYGESDIAYMNPLAKRAVYKDGIVTVEFDFAENGLVTAGGALECVEIETAFGGVFRVKAEISGSTVVVDCPALWMPEYIRYAWSDNPKANLYNTEELPAFPFRLKIINAV